MKKFLLALCSAGAILSAFLPLQSEAQITPDNYARTVTIASAVSASGAASSAKGLNVGKTYQVTSAVGSGTGSTVVVIQGSNSSSGPWDTIGTVTISTTTTPQSGSFTSLDRYSYVRANATTLTGTAPTYTVIVGF